MQLIYRNLSFPIHRPFSEVPKVLAAKLRIAAREIQSWEFQRKSLDSRRGRKPRYQVSIVFTTSAAISKALLSRKKVVVEAYKPKPDISMPQLSEAQVKDRAIAPVVVGTGPAGLFAAYRLVQMGLRPIILERGPDVTQRSKRWYAFLKGTQPFDSECNLLFGEGGAGTYSDGKLYTRVRDSRAAEVMKILVEAGAPDEITYEAKPHIGSNLLPAIIRNFRKQMIEAGAEFRFDSCLTDMIIKNGKLEAVVVNGNETLPASALFLGIGHSARDSYRMLAKANVEMSQKAFQMGCRIEHPQSLINEVQYGEFAEGHGLPTADYSWVINREDGDVFSFCMCPGGEILPSTEKEGYLCVNGASRYKRIGPQANSGFVMTVEPSEFPSDDVLAGVSLQEEIESKAYQAVIAQGGQAFSAPAQRLRAFLGQESDDGFPSHSYPFPLTKVDFEEFLPADLLEGLRDGLRELLKRYPLLDHADAIITGPESRSSSPLRIERSATYESINVSGLFPIGEGAGYAGGILSAAIDGLHSVENWARSLDL